jgi:hypothetical protein
MGLKSPAVRNRLSATVYFLGSLATILSETAFIAFN